MLDSLRSTGRARWRAFDWESPEWDGDSRPLTAERVVSARPDVVVLEGVYSCRPELADLIDVRVLLATADDERLRRLRQRGDDDGDDDWDRRWASAEEHYFGRIMRPDRFDLVL